MRILEGVASLTISDANRRNSRPLSANNKDGGIFTHDPNSRTGSEVAMRVRRRGRVRVQRHRAVVVDRLKIMVIFQSRVVWSGRTAVGDQRDPSTFKSSDALTCRHTTVYLIGYCEDPASTLDTSETEERERERRGSRDNSRNDRQILCGDV